MQAVRNRAHLVATIALAWHLVAVVSVFAVLSCHVVSASEHADAENCPLHNSAPACPRHGEKHGTHECDCPTIGCSQTDAGFLGLFGASGILPAAPGIPIPNDAGDASTRTSESVSSLASTPLSPPPRG